MSLVGGYHSKSQGFQSQTTLEKYDGGSCNRSRSPDKFSV